MTLNPGLFQPLQVGELRWPNRIVMAPLTRQRASAGRVPNAMMAAHYRARASAGLILTEATAVDPRGVGYADTPGIWDEAQVAGWRLVTEAVHAEGGRIFLQLWHVGRISDPSFLGGQAPVAPSAIPAPGMVNLLRPKRPFPIPEALSLEGIQGVVRSYRRGAELAQQAGFDGVELHAANGYLLDQFLQDSTNRRDDDYGGGVEGRARLLLEVVDEAVAVWGPGRVGVHLAPRMDSHGMGDSDPAGTFGHVARALGARRLAFLFAREAQGPGRLGPALKEAFGGVFVANQGLGAAEAEGLVAAGEADAVAWGKAFIANPDLVRRLAEGAPWNEPDPDTFYFGGERGYLDLPTLP